MRTDCAPWRDPATGVYECRYGGDLEPVICKDCGGTGYYLNGETCEDCRGAGEFPACVACEVHS